VPLPSADLDDKTFDELVKEALSRIPAYAPEWTDHNIHDPGITFIELFAWLTEMQIYRLNRITDDSRRKFLKLVGIPKLKSARSADVDLTFSPRNKKLTFVPARTQVKVTLNEPSAGEDIIFETVDDLTVVDVKLNAILSRPNGGNQVNNMEANEKEGTHYYAFKYKPESGDELCLGFDKKLPCEEITMVFHLYEDELSEIGKYKMEKTNVCSSATLIWEYYYDGDWKNLQVEDETRHLTLSGKIRINIVEETNWIRCRVDEGGYEIPPRIDFIVLNTVSATQGKIIDKCNFSSSGLPDFYLDLPCTPVIEKTLEVKVEDDTWSEVEDFDASKHGDKHYTVDLSAGRVNFGDGIHGRIPPAGKENITVSYRSGGGLRGNVGPHIINNVLGKLADVVTATNRKAATGGEEAETLEDAIIRARKDQKTIYRAVTSEDYEHLAMKTPGLRVARAKAIPRYHPNQYSDVPGIVTVVVVPSSPYDEPEPSAGFLKTVYRHLDKHRLLTTEVFVVAPKYVMVSVDAEIVIKRRYLKKTIEKSVEVELKNFLHPITGGTDGKGWPFGRPVYISEIHEIIDHTEGVDYVKTVSLNTTTKDNYHEQNGDGSINIPPYALVYSRKHKITAVEEVKYGKEVDHAERL